MPERPDLRKIASDIKEALASYPREALADILTYVFQAYVVEGAPTVHAPPPERLQDLEGLSFAEVMQTLQLRLELPELSLFEVSAGRVSVRLGGELHPLVLGADARRAAAAPLPSAQVAAAPVAAPAAPTPAPAATAAPRAAAAAAAEAPRPRGIAVNPSGGAPRPAPQQAGARPAASPSPPPSDEPGDDDAASKRFKLLEID